MCSSFDRDYAAKVGLSNSCSILSDTELIGKVSTIHEPWVTYIDVKVGLCFKQSICIFLQKFSETKLTIQSIY